MRAVKEEANGGGGGWCPKQQHVAMREDEGVPQRNVPFEYSL
jgi:hypothetical protein